MPESIIRLQQVDTCAGLSRQIYRRRNYHAGVDSHSFGCFQGLETLACRLESHRTVTATTTPILIRNTHIVDMQKTVTVALRSKRRHLHLLHHHHQHNEEDGKCRTGYADSTYQRLLPKLCPGLSKILLYHYSPIFKLRVFTPPIPPLEMSA